MDTISASRGCVLTGASTVLSSVREDAGWVLLQCLWLRTLLRPACKNLPAWLTPPLTAPLRPCVLSDTQYDTPCAACLVLNLASLSGR